MKNLLKIKILDFELCLSFLGIEMKDFTISQVDRCLRFHKKFMNSRSKTPDELLKLSIVKSSGCLAGDLVFGFPGLEREQK